MELISLVSKKYRGWSRSPPSINNKGDFNMKLKVFDVKTYYDADANNKRPKVCN